MTRLITGTFSMQDLLNMRNVTVSQVDPQAIADALQRDNASHQRVLNGLLDDLVERTTDFAGSTPITNVNDEMIQVSEDGAVQTRKSAAGGMQNYPLDKFQHGQGFTLDYMIRRSPADLAREQAEVQRTHINTIHKRILRALFLNTPRVVRDVFGRGANLTLTVKPLANGDGDEVATGPNGETFDPMTHSHYMTAPDITDSAVTAAVDTVVEHGEGGSVRLWVSRADEAKVRQLGGFTPYVDQRTLPAILMAGNGGQMVGAQNLNVNNPGNRAIGVYGPAEVWVKPYMPAGNLVPIRVGGSAKPFRMRVSDLARLQGLHLEGGSVMHPLEAKYWADYFGIGAHDRTAAAVLQITGGAYQVPRLS